MAPAQPRTLWAFTPCIPRWPPQTDRYLISGLQPELVSEVGASKSARVESGSGRGGAYAKNTKIPWTISPTSIFVLAAIMVGRWWKKVLLLLNVSAAETTWRMCLPSPLVMWRSKPWWATMSLQWSSVRGEVLETSQLPQQTNNSVCAFLSSTVQGATESCRVL